MFGSVIMLIVVQRLVKLVQRYNLLSAFQRLHNCNPFKYTTFPIDPPLVFRIGIPYHNYWIEINGHCAKYFFLPFCVCFVEIM